MPAKVCVEFTENGDDPTPDASFRSYTATIGDGTATSYTVTHGLNTQDVLYSLRNLATGELDAYDATVTAAANALSIVFAAAPAAGSVRVVVGAAAA